MMTTIEMTPDVARYIARARKPLGPRHAEDIREALRVLARAEGRVANVECEIARDLTDEERALVEATIGATATRMTDESEAFRALRSPSLVGGPLALEACRFLGNQDGRDIASIPGEVDAKGGLDGAVQWGMERLRRQAGRMTTDRERAAYANALRLAIQGGDRG